jgi:hypothetical protein
VSLPARRRVIAAVLTLVSVAALAVVVRVVQV